LLSFDAEEFDLPREHGVEISLEQAMQVSAAGMTRVLDCLRQHHAVATFFCTANFAQQAPQLVRRMVDEGHEVASHGVDHTHPQESDPQVSRQLLQQASGQLVTGYRQPRMMPVDDAELARVGYRYNSSLNPTIIPGRYMHWNTPRTWFERDGVIQVPASVTPLLRLPLFWLSLHHFPLSVYVRLACRVLNHDGYMATYFHPWEFYPLGDCPQYHVPFIIRRRCGDEMVSRLDQVLTRLLQQGYSTSTFSQFLNSLPVHQP